MNTQTVIRSRVQVIPSSWDDWDTIIRFPDDDMQSRLDSFARARRAALAETIKRERRAIRQRRLADWMELATSFVVCSLAIGAYSAVGLAAGYLLGF